LSCEVESNRDHNLFNHFNLDSMRNIAQRLQQDNPDMFDKVMALKEKQYEDRLNNIQITGHEFKLQIEAQNKFLSELAEKYGLRRELMHIEGRSTNGGESNIYLFYDNRPIGVVTQENRQEGNSYFLDMIYTPNENAHIICAEVNAMKEREDYIYNLQHFA
jgi:hypothetical protein